MESPRRLCGRPPPVPPRQPPCASAPCRMPGARHCARTASPSRPGSPSWPGTAGNSAIGQFYAPAANSIGQVDMTTGKVTTIARQPSGIGGMGAMASDPPWVVWRNWTRSPTSTTGRSTPGARPRELPPRSRPPGSATASSSRASSRCRCCAAASPRGRSRCGQGRLHPGGDPVDNLSAGTVATLDTGAQLAGLSRLPIWAKISAAGRYTLRAADAATLRPARSRP